MSSRASAKSKVASTSLFGTFLTSRAGGGARMLETAQPEDVLDLFILMLAGLMRVRETHHSPRARLLSGRNDKLKGVLYNARGVHIKIRA